MKVLQVTNHFSPCIGGIETFVKDLCINLRENGVETEVLCLDTCHASKQKLSESEIIEGIKVRRISSIGFKYYRLSFFPLSFLEKFDVIHVHNMGFFSDYLLSTGFLHKKQVVLSTHGGIWHTKNISFLKKIYFDFVQGILLKKPGLVIADSQNDFEIFSKKAKKIKLIENGVDFSRFSKIKPAGFNENFMFLGRLSKNKNLSALIEAFAIVCKERPKARLFIVGKNFDEDTEKLKELVMKKGVESNVFFSGELSEKELLKIAGQCSFCIYSSSFEGFGISVLELMSAGLIPVLNDIPTFNRFVTDSQNGFITEFGDKNAAAKKILGALSLPHEKKMQLSLAARESVQEFSWGKKILDYVKVYEKLSGKVAK